MAEPFVDDPDFTLYVGDIREVLAGLPDESVHCVVTSPPYWGLRDYGTGEWDGGDPDCDHQADVRFRDSTGLRDTSRENVKREQEAKGTPYRGDCGKCGATRVDQQIGLEPTPDLYVASMVDVFREVRRVLRRDGTCWLNLGSSYASGMGGVQGQNGQRADRTFTAEGMGKPVPPGYKPKDMIPTPWLVAMALQQDGWYLRCDIIWAKKNCMPESCTDRPTKSHEYVFLLSKSRSYYYDADAIREPAEWARWGDQTVGSGSNPGGWIQPKSKSQLHKERHGHKLNATPRNPDRKDGGGMTQGGFGCPNPSGRNKRSVWEIATESYPEAHFATFPTALVEPCIKAGTSERGCCPECGAPWERQTERSSVDAIRNARPKNAARGIGRTGGGIDREVPPGWSPKVETVGWKPACDCVESIEEALIHSPVPCVVLDPFMGSGTTALVARRLGRKSIGIELNESYAELAARRLQQLSLLADAGEVA